MNNLQPFLIAGSDIGLETDKKPFLIPDKAFTRLENAYVWRDRVKKREGLELLGRLRRVLTAQSLGNTPAADTITFANIFTTLSITGENPEIEAGSLVITIAAPDTSTFTDNGDGTFTSTGLGIDAGSYVNYNTGEVVLKFSVGLTGGAAITAAINYFPSLPTMGIIQREKSNVNFEETLIWDTKYCYTYDGALNAFKEYLPATATTWNGENYEFFWGANFRASVSTTRQLFVTNFNLDPTGNPMRYTDGLTWEDFEPGVASTQVFNETLAGVFTTPNVVFEGTTAFTNVVPGYSTITVSGGGGGDIIFTDPASDGVLQGFPNTNSGTIDYETGDIVLTFSPALTMAPTIVISYKYESSYLFSARILIPYYGRLLAFDTFEGATRATSVQHFNRVRFSQIGDPTQVGAWDSTVFGKGGFIDAPTNEEIISAIFFKNTMIVFFEKSTWQLRYVGEYGLPFIWERVSSDFGSESQFSILLFDNGVLGVGDRAIISSNAQTVDRIDLKIPDLIFDFKNANQGTQRVNGIRDFTKEIVYWCYNDSATTDENQIFPNKLLVFNYRNNTFSIFRTNATCFGRFNAINAVTWDREDVFWDDFDVLWDDPDAQSEYPWVICGNQQGFISYLNKSSIDEETLSITEIDRTMPYLQFTIQNHNLSEGDIIYIDGIQFIDTTDSSVVATDLNDEIYRVTVLTPYDVDIIWVTKWDSTEQNYDSDFSYTPASPTGTYVGGGKVTLLPKMDIVTKDFSPYMMKGKMTKLSYIDFLTDNTPNGQVSINIYADSNTQETGNMSVGQRKMQTQANPLFHSTDYDVYWNRFFSTVFGQFIQVQITYNDDQMNDRTILDQPFTLNAFILWLKEAGRIAP